MCFVVLHVLEWIAGTVKFQFYRSGDLYYKCQNGFVFTVPVSDTHDAVFKDEDRGIFFMRWIRKNIDALKIGE